MPAPFGFPTVVSCQPHQDLQSQDSLVCMGPAIIERTADAQVSLADLINRNFCLSLLVLLVIRRKLQRLKPTSAVCVVHGNYVCRQACHDTSFYIIWNGISWFQDSHRQPGCTSNCTIMCIVIPVSSLLLYRYILSATMGSMFVRLDSIDN